MNIMISCLICFSYTEFSPLPRNIYVSISLAGKRWNFIFSSTPLAYSGCSSWELNPWHLCLYMNLLQRNRVWDEFYRILKVVFCSVIFLFCDMDVYISLYLQLAHIFFFSSEERSTLYEYYRTIYPLSDLGQLLSGTLSIFFILESWSREVSSAVL